MYVLGAVVCVARGFIDFVLFLQIIQGNVEKKLYCYLTACFIRRLRTRDSHGVLCYFALNHDHDNHYGRRNNSSTSCYNIQPSNVRYFDSCAIIFINVCNRFFHLVISYRILFTRHFIRSA